MTTEIVIQAHQLCENQFDRNMRWHCDDYIISFNRQTKVLTIENFDGYTDDGDEITKVVTDPASISKILNDLEPGWIGLDGFVYLKEYYGSQWTIGTTPL